MSNSLSTFFDEVIPFVMGERGLADLEMRLGPSPSGRRMLGVYAGVVPCNIRAHMAAIFPAVKHAADGIGPEMWTRLLAAFFVAHPPRHGDPNRYGEALPGFLAKRRVEGGLPEYLEELADYHMTRWKVLTSVESGPGRTTFVRRYSHNLPAFASAVSLGAVQRAPRPGAMTVIVYRDPTTLRPAVLQPSAPQLLAYGRRCQALDPRWQSAAAVSDRDLDHAEHRLIEMGVLRRAQG